MKELRQLQEEMQREREAFARLGFDMDSPLPGPSRSSKERCAFDDCEDPVIYSGLCARHQRRASKHGLTAGTMAAVLAADICDNPGCDRPAEHIDHNHRTGIVRGHLCQGCNLALGFVDDNPERLAGLIVYLKAIPGRKRILDAINREQDLDG